MPFMEAKEAFMSQMDLHVSDVSYALAQLDMREVDALERVIASVRMDRSATIYTCGNGGSHATASHFANDLVKMVGVRAVCLGDQVPLVTAMGNDDAWGEMYAGILKRVLREKDGVIGFSCSGESPNVLRALEVGVRRKNLCAALTGCSYESAINKLGLDALVHVPEVEDIRVQEDVHLIVCHAVTRMYG
jgi:D-sedoheptulose 7-phosphate isomerase